MNHLDLQTTTEQRRAERGRRRGHHEGERRKDRSPAKDGGATSLEDLEVRAPLGGFGRRDESERSEYEREERARRGWMCGDDEGVEEEEREAEEEEEDVMAEGGERDVEEWI